MDRFLRFYPVAKLLSNSTMGRKVDVSSSLPMFQSMVCYFHSLRTVTKAEFPHRALECDKTTDFMTTTKQIGEGKGRGCWCSLISNSMQTQNKANRREKGSLGFTNPVQSTSSREVKAGTGKPAFYLFLSAFFLTKLFTSHSKIYSKNHGEYCVPTYTQLAFLYHLGPPI